MKTPEAQLLNQIEENVLKNSNIWIPCDQLAASALIFPRVQIFRFNFIC